MKKSAIRPQAAAGVDPDVPPPPMMPAEPGIRVVHGHFLAEADLPGDIRIHRPLINGEESGGTTTLTPLLDPATGRRFARIAYATSSDIAGAVDASARAFSLWRGVSFQERARKLRVLAGLIRDEAWPLADLIAQEQGKPRLEAFQLD